MIGAKITLGPGSGRWSSEKENWHNRPEHRENPGQQCICRPVRLSTCGWRASAGLPAGSAPGCGWC